MNIMHRMKRFVILLSLVAVAVVAGCKKKTAEESAAPPAPPSAAADATQTQPADATQPAPVDAQAPVLAPQPTDATNAESQASPEADLAQLTKQLHRWVALRERIPKSFDEFAATCPIKIAPPPAGKKYAITRGKVVLVNR
jgi:type IV secretory pathway VirB10-like protein